MALISPGLQLTVTDESQYVPGAVGTVPLLVLATEQDKTANGTYAAGTSKDNAGKLQVFTSQRELVSQLGYPKFKQSASGTPLHGHALNEYGLMAAYSSLALGNRLYAIRADIDTKQLESTTIRPIGDPENETLWLDLNETSWGIYEWNATTGVYTEKDPILVIDEADTVDGAGAVPLQRIGSIGSYAVVTTQSEHRTYYKNASNTWVRVGSDAWMSSFDTVTGTESNPTLTSTDRISINGTSILLNGTTVADAVNSINLAGITGITAVAVSGKLVIRAGALAADRAVEIADVVGTPLDDLGIDAGTYYAPALHYGSYVDVPSWRPTDTEPRPSGSVWIKTSAIGNGANLVIKKYNSDADAFTRLSVPVFKSEVEANYALDPRAGGGRIQPGTIVAMYGLPPISGSDSELQLSKLRFFRTRVGWATMTRFTQQGGSYLGKFEMLVSETGSETLLSEIIDVTTNSAAGFVTAIMAAGLPEIEAAVLGDGRIEVRHERGGVWYARPIAGQGNPLTTAGVVANASIENNSFTIGANTYYVFDRWNSLNPVEHFETGFEEPYKAPADGTLWFYGSPTDVDIMINDNGWKGYRNVANDARGYDLSLTDPNGVIVSASKPKTQSDGESQLKAGDLWLDTSDLENYPKLYRYNSANQWISIDNTDRVSQNGIIFADARWDTNGSTDIVAASFPDTADMLTSNYKDLDAPNYRLYPRGTLLFNTRRSGFNVKKFISDYFNDESFPNATLPAESAAWVSVSGLKDSGAPFMGVQAQRNMIIKALRSAIDGNTQVREDQFAFNLIAAPGYPELITNMVGLNNDRKNTAFIIGDTPMHLPANSIRVAEWSNNTNGDGLSTADPYMGVYYPSGLTNDVQGNVIAVPASHMALRTFIRNDNVSYPWFAPAGTRRGLIDNANDIGFVNPLTGGFVRTGVNQGMRDSLYENRVNPITSLPGVGLVTWGQKTRNPTASAMDRVNVARLVNYIRTILARVGDGFLFEPNDKITRDQIKQIIEGALNDLVAKRGIYDYLVVCDTSNNTPTRIARNELYVDIAIEPMKAVEFIYIPIRLKNPGDIDAGL